MATEMTPAQKFAMQAHAPDHQQMDDKKGVEWKEPQLTIPEYCCTAGACLCLLIPCVCCNANQEIKDYERGVLLRFGRQVHEGTLAGGMHFLLPGVDELLKIDVRERLLDIPRQKVYTRDGFALTVDAVVYFKVFNATRALLEIQDVQKAIFLLAQTKLREILGIHTFAQVQVERTSMIQSLKMVLDKATDPWGVDVTRVEMTEITLPQDMQNALGAEASAKVSANAALIAADRDSKARMIQAANSPVLVNAEREAKARMILAEADATTTVVKARAAAEAKTIQAEGELKAAEKLRDAAKIMAEAPISVNLRYMQTLTQLKGTIVVPMDQGMSSIMAAGAVKQLHG